MIRAVAHRARGPEFIPSSFQMFSLVENKLMGKKPENLLLKFF